MDLSLWQNSTLDYSDGKPTGTLSTLPGPPGGAFPNRPPPPPGPPPADLNYDEMYTIHFVALGIIIPLGILFNVLSIVVFATSRRLRNTTTGHYLIALAAADTLFLLGEIIKWMNPPGKDHLNIHINFMDRIDAVCKMITWLRYASKLASAWITVAITIERFIMVAFPLKISQISTPRIAKIVISVIFVTSWAAGSFSMWTLAVVPFDGELQCNVSNKDLYDVFNWIFLRAGSLFIPGLLIFIFCVLIAAILGRAKKVRNRQLSTRSISSVGSRTSAVTMERQLTVMLLAVSSAFILLRLPYTIAYYLHVYKSKIFGEDLDIRLSFKLYYAVKMTDIFVSINYSINFFLYCLCGSMFRRQLKKLFKCDLSEGRCRSDTQSSFVSSRNGSMKNDHIRQFELSGKGEKMASLKGLNKKF